MQVRFSGGPLYWRRRYGKDFRMTVDDTTQKIEVPGRLRGVADPSYMSADAAMDYLTTHRAEYSVGVYERVAPDRFRWAGWKGDDN